MTHTIYHKYLSFLRWEKAKTWIIQIVSLFAYLLFASHTNILSEKVSLGVDVFFEQDLSRFKGKKIALAINHTSVDQSMQSTLSLFLKQNPKLSISALFSPEHGIDGKAHAGESVDHSFFQNIPIYSLHGKTRRPTQEMLQGIDVIIYDIQCTGVRAYTYPTMLFYIMEEAAKRNIEVIVLDRPNPIGGNIIDGPMLDEKWRSYIGYINVPYCHGMTIGELALFFNTEYKIECQLQVVSMKGWKRTMSYRDTKLPWIPPSPHIPEADTPMFCPMTGILGELQIANIGIGYTLPFKIVGAPWIQASVFAEKLNAQKLPGVYFYPFHFRPFYGSYKDVSCEGVLIQVTDPKNYHPVSVQYLLLGMLKSLYPEEFLKRLEKSKNSIDLFCKANGTDMIYKILLEEKYPAWKLIEFQKNERDLFLEKRKKFLLY
jgi:uncharacterized protein YbbC (DUF1343 family)